MDHVLRVEVPYAVADLTEEDRRLGLFYLGVGGGRDKDRDRQRGGG